MLSINQAARIINEPHVAADYFPSLAPAKQARREFLDKVEAALSAYSKAHADAIKNGTARPNWKNFEVTR